jgi:hypothetical protein
MITCESSYKPVIRQSKRPRLPIVRWVAVFDNASACPSDQYHEIPVIKAIDFDF